MDDSKYYITKEKLQELKQEYEKLKQARKTKLGNESPSAFHSEELSAEFVSFQEDLDYLDTKIQTTEHILNNFELIKQPLNKKRNNVGLGAVVQVKSNNKISEFKIVGTLEADPSSNKISDKSPIGLAICGKKVGDTAIVETPDAVNAFKIIKIKY